METQRIKSEIVWYTDEIRARKRDLEHAEREVRDLENRIHGNEHKLEEFRRELARAEAEEKHHRASAGKKKKS